MAYFDFGDILANYAASFVVLLEREGGYDEYGEWKAGEPVPQEMTGAIIGFRESKIIRSGGTITAKDKRLFLLQPISDALLGSKVVYKGQQYNVESETENAEFTGVYSYTLKWVSALDEGGGAVATG